MIICGKYGNDQSRTENVTERTRFSKSRSNDLEDIGQGQRSSHATHLLMLVIICTKYGKYNRSRTENVTERTRFSRSRSNDLEDIGQGQRSLYATHPLILVIICAKYGKNPSRTVDFFSRRRPIFFLNCQKFKIPDSEKNVTRDTTSNDSDYMYQIWKESIKNCRCYRADTIFKAKAKWPWRYRSRSKVIICNTPSHTSDPLCQIWKESIENCRFFFQGQGRKIKKNCQKF